MPLTAWHVGASERRVDGDRVTELVKAKDWLSMHGDNRGPEVNPLQHSERWEMPPSLPKYLSRDHLHDRNRINALYDPAQPGQETYVRVTRRRAPPETEKFLAEECAARVKRYAAEEKQQTTEAFELLELRSMGVRAALEANKLANQKVAAGEWKPNEVPSPPSAQEVRAEQLHKKLGIDKVNLVTSPMFIDDTPLSVDEQLERLGMEAPPAAPAPAPAGASPPKSKMRGGAWPVSDNYFQKSASPPKSNKEVPLHNMGAFAPSGARAATRASA